MGVLINMTATWPTPTTDVNKEEADAVMHEVIMSKLEGIGLEDIIISFDEEI